MKLGNPHMYALMKEYSDARDTYNNYRQDYWKGVMHTLQNMLNKLYPQWTITDTGSLIWKYNRSYADAYATATNNNTIIDQI
jgi:hypothetical protein